MGLCVVHKPFEGWWKRFEKSSVDHWTYFFYSVPRRGSEPRDALWSVLRGFALWPGGLSWSHLQSSGLRIRLFSSGLVSSPSSRISLCREMRRLTRNVPTVVVCVLEVRAVPEGSMRLTWVALRRFLSGENDFASNVSKHCADATITKAKNLGTS